jgi:hypothetical protein
LVDGYEADPNGGVECKLRSPHGTRCFGAIPSVTRVRAFVPHHMP